MERMKKFFLYFVIFIAFFLFVELFTNLQVKENFQDVANHEISIESPKIDITESKASHNSGYIKGNITNDTGEHIRNKYLQFDFYDKDGIYLGTKSQKIKYFNLDEKVSFDINYEYKNVDKINIGFVDEVLEQRNDVYNIFNFDEEQMAIALPIAIILGIYVILP